MARKPLGAVDGAVCAFPDTIGVAIGDEAALEKRLYAVAQGVMHDPVTERGGGNQPFFGFVDVEAGVFPRLVAEIRQFSLDLEQVVFQVALKFSDVGMSAFAFRGFAVGQQQVGRGGEGGIHFAGRGAVIAPLQWIGPAPCPLITPGRGRGAGWYLSPR